MPNIVIERPNPKQREFFCARSRYVAYGGARGGGKSWAVRKKAMLMALRYQGIRILILRRTLPELRENHILPMLADLHGVARYSDTDKAFVFPGGSRVRFGYCDSESDVHQYQGQEYDVIFFDEATHFTEYQYNTISACNRGANDFPKRIYLTCNPGGVGHDWVKRLFIDRNFRAGENPKDYTFIPASVYDNRALLERNPEYLLQLKALPEDLRRAWLDGDWGAFAGQYFTVFSRSLHVVEPFVPAPHWRRYVALDYGLDMLAAYCIAISDDNRAYVYKEHYEPNLIVSAAVERIIGMVGGDDIDQTIAPPDLWNRRQETGKSVADIFLERGIALSRTSNDRIAGWMAVHEWLRPRTDEQGIATADLRIFSGCRNLIRTLPALQHDPRRPGDTLREPHEITHAPDALRGFCVYHTSPSQVIVKELSWLDSFNLGRGAGELGRERVTVL